MRLCFEKGDKRGALGFFFRKLREFVAGYVIGLSVVNALFCFRFAIVQSIVGEFHYIHDFTQFFAVEFFARQVDTFPFGEAIFAETVDMFELFVLLAQEM